MEQHYLELQQAREDAINAELATITDAEQRFTIGRFKGLGGSDMPKIMGASKYGSPFSVWKDKTQRTYKEVEPLSTKYFLFGFGHAAEEVIAKAYAARTGYEVRKAGEVRMMNYPFLVANFDRLICDPASPENAKTFLGGLECKTCENNSKVKDPITGQYRNKWGVGNLYSGTELTAVDSNIDPEYYPQVQFYLMVSCLPWWDVAVALGRTDVRFYRIYPDKDYQAKMLERAINFWCMNVLDNVPPSMTFDDAKTDTAVVEAKAIEASAEMQTITAQYEAVGNQIKDLEAEQEKLKDKITVLLGNATKATYVNEQGKVKTLVSFSPAGTYTHFDSTAFKNDHPDLYNQYMKEGTKARVMRIY